TSGRSYSLKVRQPSRASLSSCSTAASIPMFENLFRRRCLDLFLQEQVQGWKIGDRLGNREFCLRAKTCQPQSLHYSIHVVVICGIDLANQASASTLSAENDLESAMRFRMKAQQLYLNPLRDSPGPLGGGKQTNLIDQLIGIKRGRQG